MPYSLSTSVTLERTDTGLTLTVQLADKAGALVGSLITSSNGGIFTEFGFGMYGFSYDSFTSGFQGFALVYSGATLQAIVPINPVDSENADVKTSTRPAASDYTVARAAKLDQLDAAVSTRLPAGSYTAPDNASIAAILARTDVATSTRLAASAYTVPDNATIAAIYGRTDVATSTRLAASSYVAPDNASISAILGRVDVATSTRADGSAYTTARAAKLDYLDAAISAVPAQTWAYVPRTLTSFGFSVTVGTNNDKTGYSITSGDDAAIAAAVWAYATRTLTAFGYTVTATLGSGDIANIVAETWDYSRRTLTGGVGGITSPVISETKLVIIQGDDYKASNNRAIDLTDAGDFPDNLGAATLEFRLDNGAIVSAATFISPDTIRVELTHTQTNIAAGIYRWQLRAKPLSGGDIVTIRRGHITVLEDAE